MKTKINTTLRTFLIIALISGFQIPLLQAKSPAKSGYDTKRFDIEFLAPVTPAQADFDDPVPEKVLVMVSVAPETPKEATFTIEDSSPSESIEFLKALAPTTPSEADFTDSDPMNYTDQLLVLSRPDVPAEASFDDN